MLVATCAKAAETEWESRPSTTASLVPCLPVPSLPACLGTHACPCSPQSEAAHPLPREDWRRKRKADFFEQAWQEMVWYDMLCTLACIIEEKAVNRDPSR